MKTRCRCKKGPVIRYTHNGMGVLTGAYCKRCMVNLGHPSHALDLNSEKDHGDLDQTQALDDLKGE